MEAQNIVSSIHLTATRLLAQPRLATAPCARAAHAAAGNPFARPWSEVGGSSVRSGALVDGKQMHTGITRGDPAP